MSALPQATPVEPSSAAGGYGVDDEPGWRDVRWDEHLRSVEIAGSTVRYVDRGSGDAPPILLLHGIGGCWQNWIQNIPRIARERRVLALDFPGFGASTVPRRRITMSFCAEVVEELCERFETGPVTLVGNSMGGMIAPELAATFPERVESLVLVAPAGIAIGSLRHSLAIGSRLATLQTRRFLWATRRAGFGADEHPLALLVCHPELLDRDLKRAALLPGGARAGFALVALNRLVDLWFQRRLFEHLRAVRCPALIVWGRNDRINPVEDAARFAGAIADSRTTVLEDTGHMPMLERPREFNRLLLEFVGR